MADYRLLLNKPAFPGIIDKESRNPIKGIAKEEFLVSNPANSEYYQSRLYMPGIGTRGGMQYAVKADDPSRLARVDNGYASVGPDGYARLRPSSEDAARNRAAYEADYARRTAEEEAQDWMNQEVNTPAKTVAEGRMPNQIDRAMNAYRIKNMQTNPGLFTGDLKTYQARKKWVADNIDYLKESNPNIDWSKYEGSALQNIALSKLIGGLDAWKQNRVRRDGEIPTKIEAQQSWLNPQAVKPDLSNAGNNLRATLEPAKIDLSRIQIPKIAPVTIGVKKNGGTIDYNKIFK